METQETSLKAFEEIKDKLGERQKIILQALKELTLDYGDATDYEIAYHLFKQDPNYVRPRRYELVNKFKLVGFSQKRTCRITGKTALAWKPIRYDFKIK